MYMNLKSIDCKVQFYKEYYYITVQVPISILLIKLYKTIKKKN